MPVKQSARVEVLTAEVRVLMVGSRQVTMSVYNQLDEAEPDEIRPFGRVHSKRRRPFAVIDMIEVVGSAGGVLARSVAYQYQYYCGSRFTSGQRAHVNEGEVIGRYCGNGDYGACDHVWLDFPDEWPDWEALPLIVLAGLR